MVEERISKLEVTMGQIGIELKYITEKLDKIVDRFEDITKKQGDVDVLHEKVRELEENQEKLGPLIFVAKYPRLAGFLAFALYSLSYQEVRTFLLSQ
jgi:uncharacterized coiled-coil protein SlyX